MDQVTSIAAAEPRQRGIDPTILAAMLAGCCTFFDVYSTQPLLPYLQRVFHATEVEVSLTVSATTFAIALAAPFVGLLAEAVGRKKVIVPAIFGLSVPTFLAATSNSLHALIFWRFMQGLFVPGIIAVIIAYINEEWEGRGVGRAMSAYVSGTVLGGFLGRFVTGVIADRWGWRYSFIAVGVLTLLGGFGVRRWLPKAKRFVKSTDVLASAGHMFAHLRNPRLLANFAMGFAVLFSLVGAFTYAGFYLADPPFRLNSGELGSVFFVYLLGTIVTPYAGRFLDAHGFRSTCILALSISIAGLLLTLVHSLVAIIAGLAIFSSGVFISQAAATTQTGAVAGRARSSAAGLYVSIYYVGGSAGALVPAWFWARGGWPACVGVLIAASGLTLVFGYAAA